MKVIKTITASQYADLEHLKRMISMHQQIKDELYEKVKQIVPEQTIDGDGLFDYMYNNSWLNATLDEELNRLKIKVKVK